MAALRDWIVYVGTYTRQDSKGIYAFRFDPVAGKLQSLGLAVETSNPSFLVVHPSQKFLYAVGESNSGTVSSFAIDAETGRLKPMNTVLSRGGGPCHLAFDKTGRWLFVANYNNGSLASFPVHSDGTLGEAAAAVQHAGSSIDKQRQDGPHAHSVTISPDNRFLIVTDLGLDQLLVYRLDGKTGALAPGNPPIVNSAPGSGPRHFTFSPNGRFAWVLNEINATVTSLSYGRAAGSLAGVQTLSALPSDFTGARSAAEIAVHPNGRFVYTSNRGHDSIAIFDVDAGKGSLKSGRWVSTRGKTPRSFAIDPTGGYLIAANQGSNSLAVFRVDLKTGGLVPEGDPMDSPVPVSVVFVAVP